MSSVGARATQPQRNGSGFITAVLAPDNSATRAEVDFLGRLVHLHQQVAFGAGPAPLGRNCGATAGWESSSFTWDGRSALQSQIDPKCATTQQVYDGFGAPKSKTAPASTPEVSTWLYDELGRRTRFSVNGRVNLGYRYGPDGRLSAIVKGAPDASSPELATFTHDELGRVLTSTRANLEVGATFTSAERTVTTTRTYDDVARHFTETTQVGSFPARTVTTDWLLGATWTRRLSLPDGRTTESRFDGDGRLTRGFRANGGTTDFTWLDDLLTDTTSSAGVPLRTTVGFDELAQPSSWTTTAGAVPTPKLSVNVVRDVMGRVASASSSFSTATGLKESWRGFTYDALGRLASVHELNAVPSGVASVPRNAPSTTAAIESLSTGAHAARWGYQREAVGSVLSITNTSVSTPRFTAPPRAGGYQLSSYDIGGGTRAVTHDDAGRVTSDGTQGFVFDDMGALAEATFAGSDAMKESYLYDAQGRMVAMLQPVNLQMGPRVQPGSLFVHDGAQMVQAYSTAGVLLWTASWGAGLDSLVSMERGTDEYFALSDGRGSVSGWLSSAGEVLARAEYTPEGRGTYVDETTGAVCEESATTRCGGSHLKLPFGFHSALQSEVTGLLYFRNRWYSSETGQWLSEDPLGAVDSYDLYAFNAFDSVNHVDPMGLETKGVAEAPRPCQPGELCTEVRDQRELQKGDVGNRLSNDMQTATSSTSCRGPICAVMGQRDPEGGPNARNPSTIIAALAVGQLPQSQPSGTASVQCERGKCTGTFDDLRQFKFHWSTGTEPSRGKRFEEGLNSMRRFRGALLRHLRENPKARSQFEHLKGMVDVFLEQDKLPHALGMADPSAAEFPNAAIFLLKARVLDDPRTKGVMQVPNGENNFSQFGDNVITTEKEVSFDTVALHEVGHVIGAVLNGGWLVDEIGLNGKMGGSSPHNLVGQTAMEWDRDARRSRNMQQLPENALHPLNY